MGKRFAIVIGVAAVGVMALGAQTATSAGPVDSTPPDLQLSGPKKQELSNAVKVKASCGDEACNVLAVGDLTKVKAHTHLGEVRPARVGPASADLGPGETTTLKLKLGRKTRKKVGKVLDEGKKVQAKVIIDATTHPDTPGPVATAKRTIELVK